MADQNEIEVKITGTTGDLESDINQVESKVKNAAKGMRQFQNHIHCWVVDSRGLLA